MSTLPCADGCGTTMCSICGDVKAKAMWHGEADVAVCYWCAVKKLPALIADAVVDRVATMTPNGINEMDRTFTTISLAYHRALALALARRVNPPDEDPS